MPGKRETVGEESPPQGMQAGFFNLARVLEFFFLKRSEPLQLANDILKMILNQC